MDRLLSPSSGSTAATRIALHGRARLRRAARLPWMLLALATVLWVLCPQARAAAPVELREGSAPINLWPHLSLRADPGKQLQPDDLLAQPDSFEPPARTGGSLGVRTDAVWLRVPIERAADAAGPWVLQVHYALLHELDVYLVHQGRVVQHAALGNLQPAHAQRLPGRTPAIVLDVAPGQAYTLLMRVRTGGGMIVPLSILTERQLYARALQDQMLQGMFVGLAACLLIYSLVQWLTLREKLFLYYALLVTGSAGFSLQFFGLGSQFLWGHNMWMEEHIASLCGFLAVSASFLFIGHVLTGGRRGERYLRGMQRAAAFSAALGVAFAFGLIETRSAMIILSLLGPIPSIVSVPPALREARRGNPLGRILLLAWLAYLAASVTLALLVNGVLPASAWVMHAFQIGATVDMLLFMRLLGLRTAALRTEALRTSRERDALHSLAHSDPLTGLPNRRGLDMALSATLPRSGPDQLVGIYVLDLDGFKPVNDQFGHAIGDQLLIAVTQRLRTHLRHGDTMARIGGDEFVVMACDLQDPDQAHEFGLRLLDSFKAPFPLPGDALTLHVGLTIGYALAPLDATDGAALLRLADAAMYTGKQAGKFCLRRNTGDLALSSS